MAKTETPIQTTVVFRQYVKFSKEDLAYQKLKCGELWMCDLGENEGSIQSGYRPVFIVSNDKNNKYSPTVNVFPLTTKMNKKKLPVHVEIWDYQKYGLNSPSTIMVEQPMTIPVGNLRKRIGEIEDTDLLESICKAIGIQFPIITIYSQITLDKTEKDLKRV